MSCASLSNMPEATGFRRSAAEVMRLERLGLSHPTRLSFLRVLLRRMQQENWQFSRPIFEFDQRGVGRAVYCAKGPHRTYSLVAFGHDLPPDQRSDRVIATAWDATFCLFDGVPDETDLTRLAENVPLQEAGRVSARELCLSRANRSVRLFDHVIHALSQGRQPDEEALSATGYLMRTTAVYGSGKFGAASHASIADRPEMSVPFQAEMLSVWLIRTFTVDLIEHMAQEQGGSSALRLCPNLKRKLGVGNSTGLGMAPFLVRHPALLNSWMMVREEALARVRALPKADSDAVVCFKHALEAAQVNAATWQSEHPLQVERLKELRHGLIALADHVAEGWGVDTDHPWDTLWTWGSGNLPVEAQEALIALLLEPHGSIVDDLAACLHADETSGFAIDGTMTVEQVSDLLVENYGWAIGPDYASKAASARFWYISEDKLEPRLGERFDEAGGELELPLDVARRASALNSVLADQPPHKPVAELLLEMPEHRPMVRRAQITARRPFAEIRDNLISEDLMPIDMLRCKLACFGASRFDPRSDRWVRISLFQNYPYPDTLAAEAGL
ncbi:MAG: hypothetical protein AAFY73_05740 [Pseudomonadota bacterium]